MSKEGTPSLFYRPVKWHSSSRSIRRRLCSCRSLMTWRSAPLRKLLGKRGPWWGQMLVSVGSMVPWTVGCLKTASVWVLQGVFLFSLSCLLLLLCHYLLSSFLPTPLYCSSPFLPLLRFCSRSVEAWKNTDSGAYPSELLICCCWA